MSEMINIIPHVNEHVEKIIVYTVLNNADKAKSVVSVDDVAYLKVKVSRRSAIMQLYASFYNEKGYISTNCASYLETENGMDVYTVYPENILDKSNVYFVKFDCNTPYGKKYFSFCGNEGVMTNEEGVPFQLLVTNDIYEMPEWFEDGIIYHIFVDRFFKKGETAKRDDAVYYNDWYNDIPEYPERQGGFLRNNTFFGGNLWGVIEKLDYIESLGTKTIYLSPIFKAYSNHKYDTGDYLTVDEGFGGDEALKELLSQCEKRDIKIILDGVFNHVGEDSIYFNKFGKYSSIGAYQSPDSEYYSWFKFIDYPEDYDSWWGIKTLPKVKKIPSYRRFICDCVIPKYMKMGVSGWRLDVADELDGTFMKQIAASIKRDKKNAIVVGEVWEDASCKVAYGELKHYFDGDRLDSVTNYPLRNGLISFLKTKDSTELKNILKTLNSHYPSREHNLLMNILGTHDTERILTVLGGESSEGLSNDVLANKKMSSHEVKNAVKLLVDAFTILIALPGVPCLYYGDEAGVEGYHDPFNRRTFPWGKENKECLNSISFLGNLRKTKDVLKTGEFRLFETCSSILAFERYTESESIVTIANYSDSVVPVPIKRKYRDLKSGKEYKNSIYVEPCSVVTVELIKTTE